MKILLLDKKPSKIPLEVADFIHDLNQHIVSFQQLNADSDEGSYQAQLYDCMDFPAVLVLRDDGQLVAIWQGNLPRIDDVLQSYGLELT